MYRFKLTYNGVETEVCEPKGWDAFKSEIKRDFKSHGVVFQFTSGTIKLGFVDGKSILENAFQLEGYDAAVTFTVDSRPDENTAYTNVFTGTAVMQNRELNENYFEVDFENSTFQQKVINRLKTTLRVNSDTDLDGNALTPITPLTTDWGSIRFDHIYFGRASANTNLLLNQTDGVPAGSIVRYLQMKFINTLVDTLETKTIEESGWSTGIPTYLVSSTISGDLTFTTKFARLFSCTVDSTEAAEDTFVQYQYYLRHSDIDDVEITTYTLYDSGITTVTEGTNYQWGAESDDITQLISGVNIGDNFRVYAKMTGGALVGVPTVDFAGNTILEPTIASDQWSVKFSILKTQEIFSVSYYMIFEFLDHLINIVSGSSGKLKSSFLDRTDNGASVDGCGGLNMITNGAFLRGLTDEPEITLDKALSSILAVYGLGWGFENDGAGSYDIRVELLEYFYGDNEILDLGTPIEGASYKESAFDDLLISNVKVGYKKFSKDEAVSGDRDDFLTQSEYSLPTSTIDGNYNAISDFITSGRLIQATFESRLDTSQTWKFDKDIFMVAASRSGATFIPENDENFESVGGVDDQSTIYNLRHAPVEMFLNHALIVNSAMMGKTLNKSYINVSSDVNQDFNITFNQYESCLLGDSQRLQRSSTGNITIGNNFEGNRIFDPIKHELKIALSKTQLDLIISAMENNATDSTKNYGFLTYRDNEGLTQTGYPLTIKWNPNDEIADIETLEKADNYGV